MALQSRFRKAGRIGLAGRLRPPCALPCRVEHAALLHAPRAKFAIDSLQERDGFELPVPRKLALRRGRRLALRLGSLTAPAARPRLERDQAAPGFGEEGEHCRRVIKRRATASKARPELGALLGLKALRFGASNAVL